MNVAHQPVKDVDITMNANINVINILVVAEILFKILHVSNKNITITFEILVSLLVFIAHMNDDLVGARLGISYL